MRRERDFDAWVSLMGVLLRRLRDKEEPFAPSFLYTPCPPHENDNLNAKIDLERALGAGCRTPEEVVAFLRVVEEGWFFVREMERFKVFPNVLEDWLIKLS